MSAIPPLDKLFIHSEYLAEQNALIFERRSRRLEEQPPVLLHRLLTGDEAVTSTHDGVAVQRSRTGSRPYIDQCLAAV